MSSAVTHVLARLILVMEKMPSKGSAAGNRHVKLSMHMCLPSYIASYRRIYLYRDQSAVLFHTPHLAS